MTVIDHIVLAVSDLPKASADYALLLGRQPSWQGVHPDYGTANTLFRLDNTYIELLAAAGRGLGADAVSKMLGQRLQGLGGVVFGTDDCESFLATARSRGLDVSEPVPGHGTDDISGARRSWRNMFWSPDAARGIFSFCICHDGEATLLPAPITAAGPVSGVDHVVVTTQSSEAAKRFYGEQLGLRLALEQHVPDWGGTQLFFRSNAMSIEVIASEKSAPRDALWGLALKTDNIEMTHSRLRDSGVGVSEIRPGRKEGTLVCTVKSHTLDVPTLLISHPDRAPTAH